MAGGEDQAQQVVVDVVGEGVIEIGGDGVSGGRQGPAADELLCFGERAGDDGELAVSANDLGGVLGHASNAGRPDRHGGGLSSRISVRVLPGGSVVGVQ